jgi:hypothetical protein
MKVVKGKCLGFNESHLLILLCDVNGACAFARIRNSVT